MRRLRRPMLDRHLSHRAILPHDLEITKGSFKEPKLVFLLGRSGIARTFAPFLIPAILVFGGPVFSVTRTAEKVLNLPRVDEVHQTMTAAIIGGAGRKSKRTSQEKAQSVPILIHVGRDQMAIALAELTQLGLDGNSDSYGESSAS